CRDKKFWVLGFYVLGSTFWFLVQNLEPITQNQEPFASELNPPHHKSRKGAYHQHHQLPDPRRVDHRLSTVDRADDIGSDAVGLPCKRWRFEPGCHARLHETWFD